VESVSLESGWQGREWECDCGWSGPGSATAYQIEETRALHACPFCGTQLFQVIFYPGESPGAGDQRTR
jgi:predicted RNA-binding Zn-ribbon protein involved in translation (DUF1610 family)